MAHRNTYLLKISFRVYGKHWNKLTYDERAKVTNIYYDFYQKTHTRETMVVQR